MTPSSLLSLPPRPPAGRVLIVLHQEHSTPGRVGRLLQALGYSLDIRRPRFGEPLPITLADHVGAVIFGGPMSANDTDAYIGDEIDWIDVPLREGKPLLGICLGAQMIARHLGQAVEPHPDGHVEIGYYPILPTAAAEAMPGDPFPRWVYHWHREGFRLPPGATALATGLDFECQAFQLGGTAFGLQFHPEVTYAMICRWTVLGAHRLGAPNANPAHRQKEAWFQYDGVVARWSRSFLAHWAVGTAIPANAEARTAA